MNAPPAKLDRSPPRPRPPRCRGPLPERRTTLSRPRNSQDGYDQNDVEGDGNDRPNVANDSWLDLLPFKRDLDQFDAKPISMRPTM